MSPDSRASNTEDVTIPTEGRATVLGLDIVVVDNTEKRTEDGHDFMRVALRVREGNEEGMVHLSSENTTATWRGFTLCYRGGWRKDVQLSVSKAR